MKFFRKNISSYTDEELLRFYNETHQPEYFGELYNRYIPLLYGLTLKYLKDADKSQDAIMDLFEDLMPKICNYEVKNFRTWIYSVAKNHCLQILRKNEHEIPIDFRLQIMESDDILHLLSEEQNEDLINDLNKCIDKLPEPQQISIRHFFMDELSYTDVADITGYQLKSVKSYIQNGKRNLKICMENSTSK